MKRRDFLKSSAVAGMAGAAIPGCSSLGKSASGPKFNVHPFIRQNPNAVFVHFTSVKEKTDAEEIRQAGYGLSKELIVESPDGWSMDATVNVKPNWTSAGPKDGKPVVEKLGVNTDPNFVEGWVGAMRELGAKRFFIRESCCPTQWQPMGYVAMCERAGIDLREIST
ncbi:MAG TPA: twin-arginine translocation signal domain-containing protein, partial [Armatimonadota bacterium]|nr:twin-arginine translocation signal domain-containing protein [Armatimonadota bacterium]